MAQLVASPVADPGLTKTIPAQSHAFVEIDHERISTVILLLPLIQNGCQLQAKVCARSTDLPLSQACPGKNVVR